MVTLQAPPQESSPQESSPPPSLPATIEPALATVLVWDIETGPLPWTKLERVIGKFDPAGVDLSEIPGGTPFDPAAIKCGNLKPENAIAKIDAVREAHRQDAAQYERRCINAVKEAKEAHKNDALRKAALCATTGRVLLSGFYDAKSKQYIMLHNDKSEAALLKEAWRMLSASRAIVGFGLLNFDLPFMFRRSKIHGVQIPHDLLERYRGRYYWSDRFVDLLEIWRAGTREYITLGQLSIVLGVGEKNGDGADFAATWAADRAKAIDYCRNDLDLTAGCAGKLL